MEIYRRPTQDRLRLHVIDIEPDGTLNVWEMEKHRNADGRMDEHFCGSASLTRGQILAYARKTYGWDEITDADCADATVVWDAKEQAAMEAKMMAAIEMAEKEPEAPAKPKKKSFLDKILGR